jgi:hypothetical protein
LAVAPEYCPSEVFIAGCESKILDSILNG